MKIDVGQAGAGHHGITLLTPIGKYPYLMICRHNGRSGIQYEFEFICHDGLGVLKLYVTDWSVGENLYIGGGVRIDEDLGNWKCGEETFVFEEGPMCVQVRKEIKDKKEYAIVTRLYNLSLTEDLWRQYVTELGPALSEPTL